jgi:hypothetical protein
VLFTLCFDQPGFTLCWVAIARAYFGWFNGPINNLDLFLLFIHVIQEDYAC